MKTNVLLIGGRAKTKALARSLLSQHYSVTVINAFEEDCRQLSKIEALCVIYGDGSKPYVLEEAEAQNMQIAIALSNKDEDNLVALQLCKKQFHVARTISLISDPKLSEFFYEMGIDSVVCATTVITGILEQQAFMDSISKMTPVGNSSVSIAQVNIHSDAPCIHKSLLQINLPASVIVACILRQGINMVPHKDTILQAGDQLILVSDPEQEKQAIRELTGK